VGLEESILGKKAGNLSGGQFQRMLVAWVLVSHPQVILFDEPTTGLDVGGGETIYSLLHTIWKKEKLTIFLVTHDLSIVYKNSTNVLCLTHKRHVCYGKPDKILNSETLEQVFGTEVKIFKHNQ
jgi:zinc transport system ATP-binding protein